MNGIQVLDNERIRSPKPCHIFSMQSHDIRFRSGASVVMSSGNLAAQQTGCPSCRPLQTCQWAKDAALLTRLCAGARDKGLRCEKLYFRKMRGDCIHHWSLLIHGRTINTGHAE